MRRLMTYIVLETINGRTESLKGYTLGIDVFDRGENFDPERDSIVRVQMGRLRKILDQYYLTEGKSDPIIISVPKGSYIPQFAYNSLPDEPERRQLDTLKAANISNRLLWVFALLLIALFGAFAYQNIFSEMPLGSKTDQPSYLLTNENEGPPVIAVFPFRNLSPDAGIGYLQKGLAIELITNLSRFKSLHVLSHDSTVFSEEKITNPQSAGRKLGAQYIITGTVASKDHILKITAQLENASTGRVIWTQEYIADVRNNHLETESKIAQNVASKLGQPYGVINRQQKHLMNRNPSVSSPAYKCVLRFWDYAHEENSKNHLETRTCLEQAVKAQPHYAQAWAALSWMYVDQFRHGFNPRPSEKPLLDLALAAARKAVDLNPGDAFNRRRLAGVHIARGNIELAREEILEALALNPNSSGVLAGSGWILKNAGEWEKAFINAKKAIKLNPWHPPWYLETPFLYYYKQGDCENAIKAAKSYFLQTSPILLPHVFLIITASRCSGQLDAAANIRAINSSFPEFLKAPVQELKKLAIPDELVSKILKDLKSAGVMIKA